MAFETTSFPILKLYITITGAFISRTLKKSLSRNTFTDMSPDLKKNLTNHAPFKLSWKNYQRLCAYVQSVCCHFFVAAILSLEKVQNDISKIVVMKTQLKRS